MKWLLVCDPALPIEEYGEVLPGYPSVAEVAGCPAHFRAVYLEADVQQVRPLSSGDGRVCRLRPVWEKASLSPAELLVLGRRIENLQEEKRKEEGPAEGDSDTGSPEGAP